MSIEEIGAVTGFVEADYVTVEEAAEMLGLHRSQARTILGEPDHSWRSAAGRIQYIFKLSRVLEIKTYREEKLKKKLEQHGFRACGCCHTKFSKKDLCDGLCCSCQARKVVRNFACHGDYFSNAVDNNRLRALVAAIKLFSPQDIENTP